MRKMNVKKKRMDLMPLIKARGYVQIARIDGGMEVKNELKKLSIEIGDIVEVLERGITHSHFGPLIVKIEKDILIPRGIAEKIIIDGKKLLDVEKGEGEITSLEELNEKMREVLSKIGIEEGKKVEVRGHDIEKTYIFNIDDESYTLGGGEAAKILVRTEEGLIQANFLKGEGTIEDIIGGSEVYGRLGEIIGKKIKIVVVEEKKAHEDLSHFVTLRIGEKEVVLGRGLAEKVWIKKW